MKNNTYLLGSIDEIDKIIDKGQRHDFENGTSNPLRLKISK